MTYEKPWAKPFQRLIEELAEELHGEIRAPDPGGDGDYYFYPELHAERDGVGFALRVSDFAGGSTGYAAAADNTEYLMVEVQSETPYGLVISPEWLGEKWRTFIGVETEFETGVKTSTSAIC